MSTLPLDGYPSRNDANALPEPSPASGLRCVKPVVNEYEPFWLPTSRRIMRYRRNSAPVLSRCAPIVFESVDCALQMSLSDSRKPRANMSGNPDMLIRGHQGS